MAIIVDPTLGGFRGNILNPREKECFGSIGCKSSGSMKVILNLRSPRKTQILATLSQRADFMVFCSVKCGGTTSSGRYAFPGAVPEVIPPPSLFYSLRITHLTIFFFNLRELLWSQHQM